MKMTLGKLRSLLQESGLVSPEEFKATPKTNMFAEKHMLQLAMETLGLEIIPSGDDQSGFIGEGGSGSVWEVEKGGQRYALKLTTHSDDAEVYERIHEVRQEIPSVVAKHLPNVLSVTEIDNQEGGMFYAILMEFLVPMPTGIDIDGWRHSSSLHTWGMWANELSSKIIPQVDQFLWRALMKFGNGVRRSLINKFHGAVLSTSDWKHLKTHELMNAALTHDQQEQCRSFMLSVADPISQALFNAMQNDRLSDDEFEELQRLSGEDRNFRHIIKDVTTAMADVAGLKPGPPAFPESWNTDEEPAETQERIENPKLKSLYLALRWLAKRTDIAWNDVHNDNVMMRPGSGDLVVADVGLFSML